MSDTQTKSLESICDDINDMREGLLKLIEVMGSANIKLLNDNQAHLNDMLNEVIRRYDSHPDSRPDPRPDSHPDSQ
jgi:hypothetical protein